MKRTSEAETSALPGVANALHRAADRARVIAARTRTPLVLSINGNIEKRWVENGEAAGLREDFERYLNAVPDTEPPESDRLT
jgi:hypothetical protein